MKGYPYSEIMLFAPVAAAAGLIAIPSIMNHCEIRLLWNGATWKISSSGPPHGLETGTEFLLRLPVAAAARHPVPASTSQALVRLRDQRSHLFDGDPLPENPVDDDGTPALFPEVQG